MNLKDVIQRELNPIAREAQAAAEKLGLPARGTQKAASDELSYLLAKEQVTDDELDDVLNGSALVRTPTPVHARLACLDALELLLDLSTDDALQGITDFGSLEEWTSAVERAQAAIKRYLPKACPAPDRGEFAAWRKGHRLREQAWELEERAKALEASAMRIGG